MRRKRDVLEREPDLGGRRRRPRVDRDERDGDLEQRPRRRFGHALRILIPDLRLRHGEQMAWLFDVSHSKRENNDDDLGRSVQFK